jgi:hypothetical protein
MFKLAFRLFSAPAQRLAPVQNMPLLDQREAQEVVTALCRESQAQRQEIAELRRLLGERSAPAALVPINLASSCPAVSGSRTGPTGCPRSNYDAAGNYIGNPRNLVPEPCPLCR